MKSVGYFFLFTFLAIGLISQAVFGQGLLVNETSSAVQLPRSSRIIMPPRPIPPIPRPEPVQTYAITSLIVESKVNSQIAEVNVSQTFKNTGSSQMEVSFVFPLPYDGAIDQMTLLVDGKEYAATLQDAKEARRTYEEIVRRNRDPALLEWLGTGMFKTNVFPVPAGESRTVTLRYSQLLKVDGGVTDFLFPMSTAKYTAKPIEKVSIELQIEGEDELKNIYSPTHDVKIERPTNAKRASVKYEAKDIVPSNDFRLLFDTGTGEVSTRIISYRPNEKEDGFFMLLASPKIEKKDEKPLSKTVIFVLDRSGSMSGQKIIQARESLKFVLERLNPGDLFNIITYNDRVTAFQPEILEFTPETRKEALEYTDTIRASGATNIDGALKSAYSMLQDKKQPSYILFLTDGCPTTGVITEMEIAKNAKEYNKIDARLFSFGIGFDVNARLLDRLSRDNRGQSEYVKPDENIETSVSRVYNRISSPVLTDVKFDILSKEGSNKYVTNLVYPNGIFDLFAGEQLVLVGRYSKSGDIEVKVNGKISEETKYYVFNGRFVEKSNDQSFSFIERLWAIRRIGEILDQLDLKGQNKELVDELIALSTRHGILTPYTSFLADENSVITDRRANALRASERADMMLRSTSGASGVGQRAGKGSFQNAENIAATDRAIDAFQLSEVHSEPAMSARQAPGSQFGGITPRGRVGQPGAAPLNYAHGGGRAETKAADSLLAQQSRVQNINSRAFFQKGEEWIDSTLSESQQKPENVIVVKQFSEEYFKLIEKEGHELAQYLVFDETVLLNHRGQAYRFER